MSTSIRPPDARRRGRLLLALLLLPAAAGAALLLASGSGASQAGDLVQVRQDFRGDPGWEGVNNRIVGENCPTVVQDFGWIPPARPGASGEIGGTLWQSRTPAWYGMALGRPLTFRDRFSASGRLALAPGDYTGAAYIGFFNSTRQEWRPWSSLAIRVTGERERAALGMDYMNARWNAGGFETSILLPADGKPRAWTLTYDPDATPPERWPDERLRGYLSSQRQTADQVWEKARAAEPGVTREQIERRLREALAQGLVAYFRRSRGNFYTLNDDYSNLQGAITLQVEGDLAFRGWMPRAHRDAPVAMDRFGFFNMQVYHRSIRFFVSDLTVNGSRIDLTRDPGWDGRGNRAQFVERDFQRQDFGYSATNWAGEGIGEIGGLFYRTEPEDPLHGFYADEAGRLTLEDPISFSGSVCFVNGGTDAAMFIGYFNRREQLREIADPSGGTPMNDSLGIVVDGPTRVGYYFSVECSPKRDAASNRNGPIFLPEGTRHRFRVSYDPRANGGVGRVTAALDGETFTLDLTPAQRAAGAVFDRFGLATRRVGGKYVTLYFDDLDYTARRPPGYRPARHTQQVTVTPFPPGGRKY